MLFFYTKIFTPDKVNWMLINKTETVVNDKNSLTIFLTFLYDRKLK